MQQALRAAFSQFRQLLWGASLVLMILTPLVGVKYLLGCATLVLLLLAPAFKDSTRSALLGVLFFFAYVASPYWLLLSDGKAVDLWGLLSPTSARLLAFLLFVGLGTVWTITAGRGERATVQDRVSPYLELPSAIIIAGVLLLFHWKAFHNVIPIHTDEDYHIGRMIAVRSIIDAIFSEGGLTVVFGGVGAVLLMLFTPKQIPPLFRFYGMVSAVGVYFIVTQLSSRFVELVEICARYPLLSAWVHQLGLFWDLNRFFEPFYRVVPLLGAFSIGYFTFRMLMKRSVHPLIATTASIGIALTPSLSFFSTILYLEVPAVVLVLIITYYLEELTTLDFDELKGHPVWFSALGVGFVKETLLPLVASTVCLRAVVRAYHLYKKREINTRTVLSEAQAIFCIAFPILLYLTCRTFFSTNIRPYRAQIGNIGEPTLWLTAIRSLWAQFGPVLVTAAAGAAIGLRKKRYLWVSGVAALFFVHFFFHFFGRADLVGYGRFQLFLLGPLTALSIYGLSRLCRRSASLCGLASLVLLAVNIVLSPVDYLSGDKAPGWASPSNPYYSERYYPYREAVAWLKKKRPQSRLVVGSSHPHNPGFDWTSKQQHFRIKTKYVKFSKNKKNSPGVCAHSLKKTLKTAARIRAPLVMFYKTDDTTVVRDTEKSLYGYTAVKTVANTYQAIIFYEQTMGSRNLIPISIPGDAI